MPLSVLACEQFNGRHLASNDCLTFGPGSSAVALMSRKYVSLGCNMRCRLSKGNQHPCRKQVALSLLVAFSSMLLQRHPALDYAVEIAVSSTCSDILYHGFRKEKGISYQHSHATPEDSNQFQCGNECL